MTIPHDEASTETVDRNRLGRSIAARHLGGVAGRGGLGSVAAASLRFARGWGRPAVVRRHLSRPLPVAAGPTTQLRVAAPTLELRPPRWWVPGAAEEPAPLPGRGLRRVVRRMPSDTTSPGAGSARLAPQTVPMRMPAEIDAVGRMTTPADSRPRRSGSPVSRPPGSRPAGGPPGNARGAGVHPSHGTGADRTATGPGPAKPPTAAAPRTPTSGPVVSRLLRRRALARLTREEHARPVLASAVDVRRSVVPAARTVPAVSGSAASGPTAANPAAGSRGATESLAGVATPGADIAPPRSSATGPADTSSSVAGAATVPEASSSAPRGGADGAAPGAPGPAVHDDAAPGTSTTPVRRHLPGMTLRPLAGPVRRATTSRTAHAPLVGKATPLVARGRTGEVAAAARAHTPAPPPHAVPDVRRSSVAAHAAAPLDTGRGAARPTAPASHEVAGSGPAPVTTSRPVAASAGVASTAARSTVDGTAPAGSAEGAGVAGTSSTTPPAGAPSSLAGAGEHGGPAPDPGPRHRLPGTGHRRPAGVRRTMARSLGTDAPGLRRLTAAVPHAVAPARDAGAHAAPASVRPAATHGAAAARAEHQSTTPPVRRSTAELTRPAAGAATATTGTRQDGARHVAPPAAAAAAALTAPADHAGPLAPARSGAVRRSPAVGPRPAAPTTIATGSLTESARPNDVGSAVRALAPVAVAAAGPPSRPGLNALPNGPVVRRWDAGRSQSAGTASLRRPLLAQARGTVQGAGAQPLVPAAAGTPAAGAAAATATAPPRPSTPAPGQPPTTGLPAVRAWSVAPPLAAVGPQGPSAPATPGVAAGAPSRPVTAGAHRRPAATAPAPPGAPTPPTVFAPPPWAPPADSPSAAPGRHRTEGADVRPNLWSADPQTAGDPDVLAAEVQQRVIARLEDWIATDLDERVLDLVERRMSEETERRAWRMGSEVF